MTSWIGELIESGGYAGVFALMLLETLFPPIPSEIIMPLAGLASARGDTALIGVIAAGTLGAMLGNIFWYVLARRWGAARFERFVERHGRWLTMTPADLRRVRGWFGKHGGPAVGLGRMLPTVRSLISVPAGLIDMRWPKFLAWSTVGTLGWTAALAVAGHALGRSSFTAIDEVIGPVSNAVVVLAAATYLWRLATYGRRRDAAHR